MAKTAVQTLWGPAVLGGFRSVFTNSNFDLDDSDNKIAVIMICPKDGTIVNVGFTIMVLNGTPPEYGVTLQTLGSTGLPSGTDFGTSTVGTFTPTSTGHKWIALGSSGTTVAAGDILAAVIGPNATTPDAANSIDVLSAEITDDHGLPRKSQFTTAWSAAFQGIPCIAIQYSDDEVAGLAVTTLLGESIDIDKTPDEMGSIFQVPADMTCFGARVMLQAGVSNASWTARLYLGSDDTVLAEFAITDEDDYAGREIIDCYWDEVNLSADTDYRLIVRPDSTADITVRRITFPDANALKWYPGDGKWTGTERTNAGSWTPQVLEMYSMALWINEIDFAGAGGGSGGAYAYG